MFCFSFCLFHIIELTFDNPTIKMNLTTEVKDQNQTAPLPLIKEIKKRRFSRIITQVSCFGGYLPKPLNNSALETNLLLLCKI